MGRLKALSLAGMIMFGGAGSALAADLLPPPPPVDAPLRGAIFENSGFYVRGDAGVAINNPGPGSSTITGTTLTNLTYDWQHESVGAIVGLGAGYQFNSWFRADLTGEWHDGGKWTSQESYDSTGCVNTGTGRCLDQYSAKINHGVFLANGYADLGTWGGLTPYVGVGLGTAYNSIGGITDTFPTFPGTPAVSNSATKWTFAWALMAGMSFDVTQNLKLDVSYRYLNMGSMDGGTVVCNGACGIRETQHFKFSSNDIRIGLRYMFGEVPPPPPVLVRKY